MTAVGKTHHCYCWSLRRVTHSEGVTSFDRSQNFTILHFTLFVHSLASLLSHDFTVQSLSSPSHFSTSILSPNKEQEAHGNSVKNTSMKQPASQVDSLSLSPKPPMVCSHQDFSKHVCAVCKTLLKTA
ncbi:hypothetical protein JOB18_018068 [Solea senegalensis]|uniref:Uncharacterized protein n=1 Tax=Solea senegalensis TaxID=28829 RepID=A0AAV6REG4_SOLSE|nr:hypothetical protein JOB18_018068 [Solea senegalensis]